MLAVHWLKFGAELLVLPPASLFLLFAAGLVVARRRRWLGGGMQLGALLLLIALSLPIVGQSLLRSLEPEGPLDIAAVARSGAGAIVVLAGDLAETPEYGGVTIGALTLERLRYAARLARQSALPVLVTGGILDEGGRPLAALMRDALTADFGIAVRWVDDRAQTTDENARFSAAILRSEGIGTVSAGDARFPHAARHPRLCRGRTDGRCGADDVHVERDGAGDAGAERTGPAPQLLRAARMARTRLVPAGLPGFGRLLTVFPVPRLAVSIILS